MTKLKKKPRVIQLPRGYLSYSQKQLWKKDRKRYIEIYFNDRYDLQYSNAGMEYGKQVATALEDGVETGDLLTDTAMSLLTKYDVADKEIRCELKTKEYIVPIIGRPDTLNSKTLAFREYKTGKTKWTARKAQNHPQMPFYAQLIFAHAGVMLDKAHLDWIETYKDTDGKTKPTGHVESFEVTFTKQQILEEIADTIQVAREIENAWTSHEKPPEIPF